MEESKHNLSMDSQNNASLLSQLKKIDDIEKSISNMQAHIKFLLKRQSDEDKKINQVYKNSVKSTSSKLNLVANHIQVKERADQENKQGIEKNNKVKEFRQAQNSLLRQTRLQVSKLKEAQRSEIKQISLKNDETIRRMKNEEIDRKKNQAIYIKNEHKNKVQNLKLEKYLKQKRKQQIFLKQSMSRLTVKPELEEQIKNLRQQQKEIVERLQKKKQMQNTIKQTAKQITMMNDEDLWEVTQKIKEQEQNTENQSQAKSQVKKNLNTKRSKNASKSKTKTKNCSQQLEAKKPLENDQNINNKKIQKGAQKDKLIKQVKHNDKKLSFDQKECESQGQGEQEQQKQNVELKNSMIKTALTNKNHNMTSIMFIR